MFAMGRGLIEDVEVFEVEFESRRGLFVEGIESA
jgi:hypothetical protein